jgi:phosphoribosylamine--glycine ligase
MNVLVIGSGGREHAIAWKVAQSSLVDIVYCNPGNGGTAIENKCKNICVKNTKELIDFAKENKVDLTIVGPEAPLVEGIVDEFKKEGLRIFGPSKAAAQLEGSKAFAKEFMKKYGVKTAEYRVFEDKDEAIDYLENCSYPVVIKADGLAAGKGVVICSSFREGEKVIKDFIEDKVLKESGSKVVIEEYLEGVEASILSITDGETIIPFISSKDHKRIFDGEKGPNTGGMGVIAPNPYFNEKVMENFKRDILIPTMNGIKNEGMDYTGIIFFGIMITKKGVYLLEYNVRMGDPETQAVLPLIKSDFVEVISNAFDKKLFCCNIEWLEGCSCAVVAASGGYPGIFKIGKEISGLENVEGKVFIAGAVLDNNVLKTSGGRVLTVTATGKTLREAVDEVYDDIGKINFEGIYYRKDIGKIEHDIKSIGRG